MSSFQICLHTCRFLSRQSACWTYMLLMPMVIPSTFLCSSSDMFLDFFHLLHSCFATFAPDTDDFSLFSSSASWSIHLVLNDLLINMRNPILNFHLLAGDVLATRDSHVHCARSFVIAPFVVPQSVSFVSWYATASFSCSADSSDFCSPTFSTHQLLLLPQLFQPACPCHVLALAGESGCTWSRLLSSCYQDLSYLVTFLLQSFLLVELQTSCFLSELIHVCLFVCSDSLCRLTCIWLFGLSAQRSSMCISFVHVCHDKFCCCFSDRKVVPFACATDGNNHFCCAIDGDLA